MSLLFAASGLFSRTIISKKFQKLVPIIIIGLKVRMLFSTTNISNMTNLYNTQCTQGCNE